MAEIGHNNGPAMDAAARLRVNQWRTAQAQLMRKTIPLTIVRMRMKRATELGLDYKTYARVRQASGRDILALLFSSNALRIIGQGAKMPADRDAALARVKRADQLALVHRPNTPEGVLAANPTLQDAAAAPLFTDSWSAMRERVSGLIQTRNLPGDTVLVVGDAPLEADWYAAARAAGYLTAETYFGARG
jgi:hypothetical protein